MKQGCGISLLQPLSFRQSLLFTFSTVFIFTDRWFGLMTSPGRVNAVVAFMCVFHYGFAIFTDPGRVPSTFMLDIEDSEVPFHEIKRQVLLVGGLTNDSLNEKQQIADSFGTAYAISGLLLGPLSVALSVFLGWHICLILQNKTTIEYHEEVTAKWPAEKGGDVYKHPYDLGAYENLRTVLGPSVFCWMCPTSRHIGNGLRFQTAYDGMSTTPTAKMKFSNYILKLHWQLQEFSTFEKLIKADLVITSGSPLLSCSRPQRLSPCSNPGKRPSHFLSTANRKLFEAVPASDMD